jgi:hypothetical protein
MPKAVAESTRAMPRTSSQPTAGQAAGAHQQQWQSRQEAGDGEGQMQVGDDQ